MSSEFDLIKRIQQRIPQRSDVETGIGDDACVLAPSVDHQLVCTTDSIVLDCHFTEDWPAQDVGHLAMAVNLSDLAAMGALPRWVMLSLTLPNHAPWTQPPWLDKFLDGFLGACPDVILTGGNMAGGPLNIGVCLMGEVPSGQAIMRSGAQPGDALVVTGHLGDVAGALALSDQGGIVDGPLERRMKHPTPRVRVGQQAWGVVHAMIDISDGLLADLGHMLEASSNQRMSALGAALWLETLPASAGLMEAFPDPKTRWPLQLGGGSDYELLMSVPSSQIEAWLHSLHQMDVPASVIGRVVETPGIDLIQPDGQRYDAPLAGWDHFRST